MSLMFGVRPALFPAALRPALNDLRAFRHVIRHAYELTIDRSKDFPVPELARGHSRTGLSPACEEFLRQVRSAQGWGEAGCSVPV